MDHAGIGRIGVLTELDGRARLALDDVVLDALDEVLILLAGLAQLDELADEDVYR